MAASRARAPAWRRSPCLPCRAASLRSVLPDGDDQGWGCRAAALARAPSCTDPTQAWDACVLSQRRACEGVSKGERASFSP